MAALMDEISAFDEFKNEVLPSLRADLKKGLTADEIYKKYQHLAAARNITIAMTEQDSSKALAAIKDVLDRAGGKAKERKEIDLKYSNLPEDQLDALLKSKAAEAGADLFEDEDGNGDSLQ
jgi:hypothetical protein